MMEEFGPVFNRQHVYRQTLRNGVLIPLFSLVLIVGGLAMWIDHFLTAAKWDRHSVEVLAEARGNEKLLIDMETGLRGFQLTGNSNFLEPYTEAEPQLRPGLSSLSHLVADNPQQIQRVDRIRLAEAKWLDYASHAVTEGKAASLSPAEIGEGKRLMDSAREAFLDFSRAEEDLLRDRTTLAHSLAGSTRIVGLGLISCALVVMLLWIRRQIALLDEAYHSAIERIRVQREWFRVTLSSIGDAVIVTNRDGKVRFLNAEAERLTGWDWPDAKDKSLRAIFRIVNEETRNSVDDPVEKVFRENRVVGLANHTLLISKNGTEWPIMDSAAPILSEANEIIGVVLVFHDATELRKANHALKFQSEELEKRVVERTMELNRTVVDLEAFSYTISHDLRAPLRAMKGFSDILKEDYGSELDAEGCHYLSRISSAADRLDVLIRDILAYSKVSADKEAIHVVDLDSVIGDVIQQYPGIKEHDHCITIAQPLGRAMGHEAPLTQIIANLLTNALKFASPDREVRIKIWTEMKPNAVQLSIEDNGIGIPDNHFARIFEMFEQVNPKSKPGTGIGLAIVKKAAAKMQATVGVDSTLGKGSRFWVELLRPMALDSSDNPA